MIISFARFDFENYDFEILEIGRGSISTICELRWKIVNRGKQ